jgi:hypothetical protein
MSGIDVSRQTKPVQRIRYLLQKHRRRYATCPIPPPKHIASTHGLELDSLEQALAAANAAVLHWRLDNPRKQLPLPLKLAAAKATRQADTVRRRVKRLTTRDRPLSTLLWTVHNADGSLLCRKWPTHKLLVLLLTEEYHCWRSTFFDIDAESQECRIRNFAAALKLSVAMSCPLARPRQTATQALCEYRRGLTPDPRRWRLYDPLTGAVVHPMCIARAIGETPAHVGLTTQQMADFMHKSGLDPRIPYRVPAPLELTFLSPSRHFQAAVH